MFPNLFIQICSYNYISWKKKLTPQIMIFQIFRTSVILKRFFFPHTGLQISWYENIKFSLTTRGARARFLKVLFLFEKLCALIPAD